MAGSSDIRARIKERIDKRTQRRVLNRQLGIENIRRHSFENVKTGGTKDSSSVLSGSVEDKRLNGGRPTLVPFLYKGKVVSGAEAVKRAIESGRTWPAFDTNEEATEVSKKISAGLGAKNDR